MQQSDLREFYITITIKRDMKLYIIAFGKKMFVPK